MGWRAQSWAASGEASRAEASIEADDGPAFPDAHRCKAGHDPNSNPADVNRGPGWWPGAAGRSRSRGCSRGRNKSASVQTARSPGCRRHALLNAAGVYGTASSADAAHNREAMSIVDAGTLSRREQRQTVTAGRSARVVRRRRTCSSKARQEHTKPNPAPAPRKVHAHYLKHAATAASRSPRAPTARTNQKRRRNQDRLAGTIGTPSAWPRKIERPAQSPTTKITPDAPAQPPSPTRDRWLHSWLREEHRLRKRRSAARPPRA